MVRSWLGRARPVLNDSLQHRRCEEGAAARMVLAQIQEFARIESAAQGHHLASAAQHVGRDVEARTMRHRRGVHQTAPFVGCVDVGEVGDRHRHQVAVGEHGAF